MRLTTRVAATARLARELPRQSRIPFESRAQLARRRDRAVRAAVAHAAERVPFWREAFSRLPVAAREVAGFDDLARLPIVTRDDVQSDPERFLAEGTRVADCLELRSSGTCGTPVTVWWNPGAAMAAAANMGRQRRLVQRRIGRRSGYLQANLVPSGPTAARLAASYFRGAAILPDRFHVQHDLIPFDAPADEQLARLRASGAAVLGGYGSAVERLLLAGGAPDLQVVLFGADSLSDAAREAAQKQGVLVLGAYASVEALRMGWECGNGPRLHLDEDVAPIRLVDAGGAAVAPGEPGRVVVSNLVNRASVLLNYLQGDIGVMEGDGCPCGRNLSLMTLMRGRTDEYLLLGGEEVHPHSMGGFATDGVRRFRLVQSEPDRLVVEVEPAPAARADAVREQVERWCSDRFEEGTWEVRLVDELLPGPNGKHRVVVGMIPR